MCHCERDESCEHGRANRVTLRGEWSNLSDAHDTVRKPTSTPVRLGSISRAHILSTCGSLEKSLALSGTSSVNDISGRNKPVPVATSTYSEGSRMAQGNIRVERYERVRVEHSKKDVGC